MRRRNFLSLSSAGTITALTAAARWPQTVEDAKRSAGGENIVLGMSAAFKGPSRGLGIELYRGAMAYFDEVNRTGGIRGRKIVIKAYDDNYNPLPTIENTVKLVEEDEVLLLFGYVGTPTVTRILPLLKLYSNQQRSIYLFFPFSGAQPLRQAPYAEFVFNLRASYYEETARLVDRFVAIGRKDVAVFYQIDSYGRDGWNGVKLALAEHKLRVAGEATYRRGTRYADSLRPQVEILRKTNPDAVICVGAYAACGGFIRDARDAGWDVPIANVSFVGSDSLLAMLLESGQERGKDYTSNLINSEVVPNYRRTELPVVRQYRDLMTLFKPMPPADLLDEAYKPIPYSYVGFEGFLNARLLVQVLRKMGGRIQREQLRAVVESVKGFDLGIDAPVSFGRDKHQGLDQVYFSTVEDGHFVQFEDWKKWSK